MGAVELVLLEFIVYCGLCGTFDICSYYQVVLLGLLLLGFFKDKIVFVGCSVLMVIEF